MEELLILSYLWGIETYETLDSQAFGGNDFILPMRNWNLSWYWYYFYNRDRILSYLWGIETPFYNACTWLNIKDFILPMRNWNMYSSLLYWISWYWFYLTYEELKLHYTWIEPNKRREILSYLWGIETLLSETEVGLGNEILSYLWGIETPELLRRTGQKIQDFILPMRNWNSEKAIKW